MYNTYFINVNLTFTTIIFEQNIQSQIRFLKKIKKKFFFFKKKKLKENIIF